MPRRSFAIFQIHFQIEVAPRRIVGSLGGFFGERRPSQIRVQDNARGIDDAPQVGTRFFKEALLSPICQILRGDIPVKRAAASQDSADFSDFTANGVHEQIVILVSIQALAVSRMSLIDGRSRRRRGLELFFMISFQRRAEPRKEQDDITRPLTGGGSPKHARPLRAA